MGLDNLIWSEVRPAGDVDKIWRSVSCDTSGSIIYASTNTRIYRSADRGVSWNEINPIGDVDSDWCDIACSSQGSFIITSNGSRLYLSEDGGENWTETRPLGDIDVSWREISCSYSGCVLFVKSSSRLYKSMNSGSSWEEAQPLGDSDESWLSISVSGSGNLFLAGKVNEAYYSTDSGSAWNLVDTPFLGGSYPKTYVSFAANSEGNRLSGTSGGVLFYSDTSGSTWYGYFWSNGTNITFVSLNALGNIGFSNEPFSLTGDPYYLSGVYVFDRVGGFGSYERYEPGGSGVSVGYSCGVVSPDGTTFVTGVRGGRLYVSYNDIIPPEVPSAMIVIMW